MITKYKKPKINYQYCLEIETDETPGEDDGCGIFRGSEIISTTVKSFSKLTLSDWIRSSLINSIHQEIKNEKAEAIKQAKAEAKAKKIKYAPLPKIQLPKFSDLDVYGIDRIVMNTPFSTEQFTVTTGGGYYGEEIYGASLDWEIEDTLFDKIKKYLSTDDIQEKIKFLLEWEYGYFPEFLQDKVFSVKSISLDKVKFTENKLDNFVKLDPKTISEYMERFNYKHLQLKSTVPIGIVAKNEDGSYQLIDGKHQVAAAKQAGKTKASFIVAQ